MRIKLILTILILMSILVSCSDIPGVSKIFSSDGSSSGSGRGFEVKFSQAPKSGTTLTQNDNFAIVIDVSNYIVSDKPVSGKLCLKDSSSDSYGGIKSNECKYFNVPPGEEVNDKLFPGQIDPLRFPSQGFYSYTRLDEISIDNEITADLYYDTQNEAGAVACIAMPQIENAPKNCIGSQRLSIQQQDSPLEVSSINIEPSTIDQSTVRLKLELTLSKKEKFTLLSPGNLDSSALDERVKIDIALRSGTLTQPLSCQGVSQGFIEFRPNQNEKIIKCTASIKLNQEFENIPVIINTVYGVKKTIQVPKFKLKKEESVA